MNARAISSAAGVILAAIEQGRVPAGIALALDAAGMLQSPERAAEITTLRERVAELETARAAAVDRLRHLQSAEWNHARVAGMESIVTLLTEQRQQTGGAPC